MNNDIEIPDFTPSSCSGANTATPPTSRPTRDRVGPLSTRRDDAAIAEEDNRRARRPRKGGR
jgi:hypothetical protein